MAASTLGFSAVPERAGAEPERTTVRMLADSSEPVHVAVSAAKSRMRCYLKPPPLVRAPPYCSPLRTLARQSRRSDEVTEPDVLLLQAVSASTPMEARAMDRFCVALGGGPTVPLAALAPPVPYEFVASTCGFGTSHSVSFTDDPLEPSHPTHRDAGFGPVHHAGVAGDKTPIPITSDCLFQPRHCEVLPRTLVHRNVYDCQTARSERDARLAEVDRLDLYRPPEVSVG